MIKQVIVKRKYKIQTNCEDEGNATYVSETKDYESFDNFVNSVTNTANKLGHEIISVSYPDSKTAIIVCRES